MSVQHQDGPPALPLEGADGVDSPGLNLFDPCLEAEAAHVFPYILGDLRLSRSPGDEARVDRVDFHEVL